MFAKTHKHGYSSVDQVLLDEWREFGSIPGVSVFRFFQFSLCVQLYPCEFSRTDKEKMDFPECYVIFLVSLSTTDKEKLNFSVFPIIYLSLSTTTKKRWTSLCVLQFSLCVLQFSCEFFLNHQVKMNFLVGCWKNTQGNCTPTGKKPSREHNCISRFNQ